MQTLREAGLPSPETLSSPCRDTAALLHMRLVIAMGSPCLRNSSFARNMPPSQLRCDA